MTTLGTGVDGSVRRIATEYEVRGLIEKITSYDNAAVGSGSVLNEVKSEYNDFAQVSVQYQTHAGAVNTSTTPKVQYSYADGSANTIRPTGIIYPNGRQIEYNYGTSGGMDDVLSRLQSISESTTELAAYTYLGAGMVVQVEYTEPDIRYDLITGTGDDPYDGLDRFNRVIDCLWRDYGSSTDAARIKYGYDRVSNRTWRENPVDTQHRYDQLYSYDGLYRLTDLRQGQLNANKDAILDQNFRQAWNLDATGNWSSFDQDDDGDGTWNLEQSRTANKVNEITDITNSTGMEFRKSGSGSVAFG